MRFRWGSHLKTLISNTRRRLNWANIIFNIMITKLKSAMNAAPAGGGSGGSVDDGNEQHSIQGAYTVTANNVQIISRTPHPPAKAAADNVITLLATGNSLLGAGPGGKVELRGNQGVRITAGPPLPLLPTSSNSTNGVEIVVGEMQNVTFQRGLLPVVDQKIEMTPSGITVDAGKGAMKAQSLKSIDLSCQTGAIKLKSGFAAIKLDMDGTVTIQSATAIKLSAGLGLSEITLDMDGVTIEGATVNIKGASVNLTGGEATPTIGTPAVNIEGPLINIKGDLVKIN